MDYNVKSCWLVPMTYDQETGAFSGRTDVPCILWPFSEMCVGVWP